MTLERSLQQILWLSTMTLLLLRNTAVGFSTRYAARRRVPSSNRVARLFAEPPIPPQAVQSLLRGALSRAKRTLSEKDEVFSDNSSDADSSSAQLLSLFGESNPSSPVSPSQRADVASELLGGIASRAKRTLSTKSDSAESPTPANNKLQSTQKNSKPNKEITPTAIRYNQNPAVSLTALAHWLWASVLRPHEDTAIDATCGNGYDAAGIASILMGNEDLFLYHNSELICIDIQEQACQATKERLSQILHPKTLADRVCILPMSHANLPVPKDPSSVGLVVYNLGYLPNSTDKELQTKIESTVSSIVDALLLIRVGGMVSVMTYPGSNKDEDFVVRSLLEAVVAMTNTQGPKWYTFVDALDCSTELKEVLTQELRRISTSYEENKTLRTFRVSEHKKIGLAKAPILMTATRIK